jgi:flagellar basal-body rod modification protein FlgD
MDIGRAAGMTGMQTVAGGGEMMPSADSAAREQAMKNAVNQLQARYGEKPKEARPIKKQLDKDDFMRIMITEMRHQDPTKPMDSDRMATQMAQITSVEQLKNVSGAIEKLSEKSSASDRLAMSAMIGKNVTVDKSRFAHQKGMISPLNFTLPEDADKIRLTILDERGEEVATRELEAMKAGMNVYNWDGINSSSMLSGSGTYLVRVDAENAQGKKIKIDPVNRDTVVGVSFDGGETHFLVGDAKNPQKVNFKNVIRIESDAPQKAAAPIQESRVGESSSNPVGGDALPPGLKEKLNRELAQSGSEDQATGFPNGLSNE